VTDYVTLAGTASNVAVGNGRVWALEANRQSVVQIDARTGRIVGAFTPRGTATDLAVGAGAVWVGIGATTPQSAVGTTYTSSVSRVDPVSTLVTHTAMLPGSAAEVASTAEEPFRLPGVSQLAVGAGAVWAIDPDHTVSRIDSRTGKVVARVRLVATHSIAAGAEGVWTIGKEATLIRIDPRTNRVGETIRLEATGLGGIALGFGSVWVTDPADGLVWRIEPGPNPVTRSIDAGVGVTSISTGGGAVWATNFIDGHVLRIDPQTNQVTARITTTATPEAVAAGDAFAWVTVSQGEDTAGLPAQSCGAMVSGGVRPDVLIASDLPLRGAQRAVTRGMADAIAFVLHAHDFRAGKYSIGFQSCDDSTAQTGIADFFSCAANARAYASTPKLVAVIGTYDSYCSQVEVPIADNAPGGPLAMISPSNTQQDLTRAGPGVARGAPAGHYPAGVRNYVRLAAPDDVFAAGAALLAKGLALDRVYVLTTGTTGYGVRLAHGFSTAAAALGVGVAGTATWNPDAKNYTALAGTIASSGADGVFLADFDLNGGALIRALRARLGQRTTLILSDGFLPVSATVKEAGSAALGGYVLYPGAPVESLGPAAQRFARRFAETQPRGRIASGSYVAEAAAAAEVLLQAIGRSDGSRASILRELRRAHVVGSILGSFRFDANGDMTPALVSVFRITGRKSDGKTLLSDFRGSQIHALLKVPTSLVPAHSS
jgi:branched-chain amino acid transport system substrate-binding protein